MKAYGRLSRRSLDELLAGARVDVAPYKRDPMDFVLWKPSKAGEPSWPSPGRIKAEGRPGWHIECSAMAWKHLGEVFDIHGGGIDLVFPHHENEVAQTCCAFHSERMAQVWMHNGFLQVEGDKMSKSLGNFVTIRELLSEWHGEVLRLNMLKTHYRSPMDWTEKGLEESKREITQWYEIIGDDTRGDGEVDGEMLTALADDLNTHGALTRLRAIASEIRGSASGPRQLELKRVLKVSAKVLGLLGGTLAQFRASDPKSVQIDGAQVDAAIAARAAARARKDFKESDRIRDELVAMGVILKDGKDAAGKPVTTWELAP
jgi:cysteinyl-tRNA synthetase